MKATLALIIVLTACVGCAISVRPVSAQQQERQAYRVALIRPFNALTAAANKAQVVCVGGQQPDPHACYADTQAEIQKARSVERILRSSTVPRGYATANADFIRGITLFIEGLRKRSQSLLIRSGAEYAAGDQFIAKGNALQKQAISEYPKGSGIN